MKTRPRHGKVLILKFHENKGNRFRCPLWATVLQLRTKALHAKKKLWAVYLTSCRARDHRCKLNRWLSIFTSATYRKTSKGFGSVSVMKPIVSDTGKNQSDLFVIFVVVDSKLILPKHWIHEMWVLSKQVLTVRHNVSPLK